MDLGFKTNFQKNSVLHSKQASSPIFPLVLYFLIPRKHTRIPSLGNKLFTFIPI